MDDFSEIADGSLGDLPTLANNTNNHLNTTADNALVAPVFTFFDDPDDDFGDSLTNLFGDEDGVLQNAGHFEGNPAPPNAEPPAAAEVLNGLFAEAPAPAQGGLHDDFEDFGDDLRVIFHSPPPSPNPFEETHNGIPSIPKYRSLLYDIIPRCEQANQVPAQNANEDAAANIQAGEGEGAQNANVDAANVQAGEGEGEGEGAGE